MCAADVALMSVAPLGDNITIIIFTTTRSSSSPSSTQSLEVPNDTIILLIIVCWAVADGLLVVVPASVCLPASRSRPG